MKKCWGEVKVEVVFVKIKEGEYMWIKHNQLKGDGNTESYLKNSILMMVQEGERSVPCTGEVDQMAWELL